MKLSLIFLSLCGLLFSLTLNSSTHWRKIPFEASKVFKSNLYRQKLEFDQRSNFIPRFRYPKRGAQRRTTGNRHFFINPYNIKLDKNLSEADKDCWYNFLGGGYNCHEEIPEPLDEHRTELESLDLLKYSRYVSKQVGMAKAKSMLEKELRKLDDSKGLLEERILVTTNDKSFVFEDAISTLDKGKRERIGVYFCLGIGGTTSANAILMQRASDKVKSMGFQSEMLQVDAELGSDHNAAQIRDMMLERIENLDKVVLVAASKGVADFITFFLNHSEALSEKQRNKFRLMVSLSGVIRGSHIAKFLSKSKRFLALMARLYLGVAKRKTLKGVKSLARDPWEGHDPRFISRKFSNLKWISYPVIPEGRDGYTYIARWSEPLRVPAHRYLDEASPGDGLVETASSILPPDTNIEQWIIPAYGAHGLAIGSYKDGTMVAPISQKGRGGEINPESGDEILDAFFRALPKRLIE